ncbi:MAG: hypothetical protein WC789_04890 [Lentisphaeria bacterium]|jgi:hypothetical protein
MAFAIFVVALAASGCLLAAAYYLLNLVDPEGWCRRRDANTFTKRHVYVPEERRRYGAAARVALLVRAGGWLLLAVGLAVVLVMGRGWWR